MTVVRACMQSFDGTYVCIAPSKTAVPSDGQDEHTSVISSKYAFFLCNLLCHLRVAHSRMYQCTAFYFHNKFHLWVNTNMAETYLISSKHLCIDNNLSNRRLLSRYAWDEQVWVILVLDHRRLASFALFATATTMRA